MNNTYPTEHQRLGFLIARDGPEATVAFAKQTMRTYRRAVLTPKHFAGTREFRSTFIHSYLDLKRFVFNNGGF